MDVLGLQDIDQIRERLRRGWELLNDALILASSVSSEERFSAVRKTQ
jgi:hypothetical protein